MAFFNSLKIKTISLNKSNKSTSSRRLSQSSTSTSSSRSSRSTFSESLSPIHGNGTESTLVTYLDECNTQSSHGIIAEMLDEDNMAW
ncbi:hypothetical protein L208DRAFT_1399736 [Tricholoma matsutake]|nr:hypothetical protein L208DRAFT_1399736 [Tricholoma matsutake 945]